MDRLKDINKEILYKQVYQKAFDLNLEWGQYWGSSINERIQKLLPHLSIEEIESLNKECFEIQNYGKELIQCYNEKILSQYELIEKIKKKYPKLSHQNIEKLLNNTDTKNVSAPEKNKDRSMALIRKLKKGFRFLK